MIIVTERAQPQPRRYAQVPSGRATLGDVWAGDFGWMSDDYEIVRADDVERLNALNLADDLGLP